MPAENPSGPEPGSSTQTGGKRKRALSSTVSGKKQKPSESSSRSKKGHPSRTWHLRKGERPEDSEGTNVCHL
jgi:hypothetical protein